MLRNLISKTVDNNSHVDGCEIVAISRPSLFRIGGVAAPLVRYTVAFGNRYAHEQVWRADEGCVFVKTMGADIENP